MTSSAAPRITLRRTVPFDLVAGDDRLTLTINDMRSDPDRVVLGLSGPGVRQRIAARLGEEVLLGGDTWVVASITTGDRGSVVLVGRP